MSKYLITIILLASWGLSFGQNRTISGRVTSIEDGKPSGLPGVNVVVAGTSKGTVTDTDGNYRLELGPGEERISFSFIGYKSVTEVVGTRTVIDVQLESDTQALEEVVVIGYGTVRKSDLTGSVSSLRGNDLTKIPSASPLQALQGKVPGLQITSASGAPGAGTVVRIRGVGTFNNSSPIYVVDGVILDNIDYLSSADIESIEVLKDASATAIYGSRGANGVIMVTTRHGSETKDYPTISVSAEYSVQQVPRKIGLLNGKQFAGLVNELIPGSYNNTDAVPNTDWQDQIFRTAPIQNHQVSMTGAAGKYQYYVGFGYFKQEGIIPKSSFERYTIRLNNSYQVSQHVKIGNNVSLAPVNQQNTRDNVVFTVYRAWPTVTPFQPDGSYSEVRGVGNPLADIEYTNSFSENLRLVGNVFAEVNFLKDFTFRTSYGVDWKDGKDRSFTPVFYVSPQQTNSNSLLTKGWNDQFTWLWENTVSVNKKIGDGNLNAVAGYTMQNTNSEVLSLQGKNIIRNSPDFWYLTSTNLNPSAIVDPNRVEADLNYSMISYLFRVNYSWKDKYLVTATFRRDGSSKFNSNNRYANFPSVAVGWNIINEDFMKTSTLFSNLKFRVSYGVIGNEKIAYDRQFSSVANGVNAVFGTSEVLVPGLSYGVSGNPNLTWESSYQTDVGLEMGFFDDKLTAEIDYYRKETKDILIALNVPGYLGNGDGAQITYNAAQVLNQGFEFNLNWKSEIGQVKYQIGAVGTTISNETLRVSGSGGSDDNLKGLFNGSAVTLTAPGRPIGSFYGYEVIGVFQNAADLAGYPHKSEAGVGDLKFKDTNNDGSITDEDRVNLGSPIPTFMFGLNTSASWKGIELSADFQGQTGNKIYNGKETVRPDLYNYETRWNDRWKGDGTSNSVPRASAGGYNFFPSSFFIQDGSYLRLRSVTIGYNLPTKWLEKVRFKSAKVYVRGTNLFTLTKFTGYTPEVASAGSNASSPILNGIDGGSYPIPTVYSAGFNITF